MTKSNNRPSFPQRLFLLLKLVEDKGLDHIVSWVNDGAAFKVNDLKQFQEVLLPKYFSTKKYASFTRQLCAYGFSCLRTGRQTGIYSHPSFHRDDPASSFKIKRESAKHAAARTATASQAPKSKTITKSAVSNTQPAIPKGVPMTFEFPAIFGSGGRATSADHSKEISDLHQLLCTPTVEPRRPVMLQKRTPSFSPVPQTSAYEHPTNGTTLEPIPVFNWNKTFVEQTQPVMTHQTRPRSHVRKVSAVDLANPAVYTTSGDIVDDLDPLPVFNLDNPLPSQRRGDATVSPFEPVMVEEIKSTSTSNYVPLSPQLYSEVKEVNVEPMTLDLFVPTLEPQSIDAVATPI